MSRVVLWLGPVSTSIIGPTVESLGWSVRTVNRGLGGGIGSEAFKQWALSLGPDPLSRVVPGAREVVVAGFSAAHGAAEVFLGKAAGQRDERVVGLVALDSYYSAWNVETPKPGFLAWCRFALERGLPAWFTTSGHHPAAHPSASKSIEPLAAALELGEAAAPAALLDLRKGAFATARAPGQADGAAVPGPERVQGRGSVLWLDYGLRIAHADHANVLAAPALRGGPFLMGSRASSSAASSASSARASVKAEPGPSPGPLPVPAPPAPPSPAPSSGGGGVVLGLLGLLGLGVALSRRR